MLRVLIPQLHAVKILQDIPAGTVFRGTTVKGASVDLNRFHLKLDNHLVVSLKTFCLWKGHTELTEIYDYEEFPNAVIQLNGWDNVAREIGYILSERHPKEPK